jgi:membrane-bound serine protease (ClpP class)
MISSVKVQRFWLFLLSSLFLINSASAETFSQQAGSFLTTPQIAGILLTLGILFWFMSVVTMGTGIAEVCCFTTFALLFGGRYLTGDDIWVPLALFVAGAVFALVEVFIIPGLGVFGVLSMISFAGLSVLLMDSPQVGLGIFSLSIVLSMVCGLVLMKFLPKFFVTRKFLVLEPPTSENTPKKVPIAPAVSVGDVGEAASTLRPIGTAVFGGKRLEVMSEGEFLKKGQAVEVVRVEAQKVVVKSCQK